MYDENPYGWGTKICLNDEQVKAIFGTALPEAGKPVTITAQGFIAGVSMEADVENGTEKRVELQVTEMDVQPAQDKKPAEQVLWGNPNA